MIEGKYAYVLAEHGWSGKYCHKETSVKPSCIKKKERNKKSLEPCLLFYFTIPIFFAPATVALLLLVFLYLFLLLSPLSIMSQTAHPTPDLAKMFATFFCFYRFQSSTLFESVTFFPCLPFLSSSATLGCEELARLTGRTGKKALREHVVFFPNTLTFLFSYKNNPE